MNDRAALALEIRRLLAETLMLKVPAEQISESQPLFGPGGLGLDSVDALQLVVALDKNYGLRIPDPATAQQVLQNVDTIVTALTAHRAAG